MAISTKNTMLLYWISDSFKLHQPREQSEMAGILTRCKEKGLVDYTETEDNRLPKTKKKGKKASRQQAAAASAEEASASGEKQRGGGKAASQATSNDATSGAAQQLEPAFSFNKGVLSTNLKNFAPGLLATGGQESGSGAVDADAAQKQRLAKLEGAKKQVGVSESLFPSKVMQAISETVRRERAQRQPQYRVALKHPADFRP